MGLLVIAMKEESHFKDHFEEDKILTPRRPLQLYGVDALTDSDSEKTPFYYKKTDSFIPVSYCVTRLNFGGFCLVFHHDYFY